MHPKYFREYVLVIAGITSALVFAIYSLVVVKTATAQENSSKTHENSSQRENYFPNTETLGADEMRVIALGTGVIPPF